MAQYVLFLVLAPLAFLATTASILLPRFHRSYHRFERLYILQLLHLGFLTINTAELLVSDPTLKRILAAGDYLFFGIGASLFFLFSLEYTGVIKRFKAWELTLFILPAICFAAGTSPAYSLIWKDWHVVRVSWLTITETSGYGILARAVFAQAFMLTAIGAWVIGWATLSGHSLYRKQTRWMLLGVTIPAIVSLAYIARVIPGWRKDFSPVAVSAGMVCFAVASLRHRLFAVIPISRKTVLEHLRFGMIVVDSADTIIDLNQTACRMIGKSETGLLGSAASPIVADLEARFEITRTPIQTTEDGFNAWHLEIREQGGERPASEAGLDDALGELPNRAAAASPVLSLGELRVVELLAHKLSNKEIADRLGVSANTVKFHLANVFRKTGAKNRAELVNRISEILNAR